MKTRIHRLDTTKRSVYDAFSYLNRLPDKPYEDEEADDFGGRVFGRFVKKYKSSKYVQSSSALLLSQHPKIGNFITPSNAIIVTASIVINYRVTHWLRTCIAEAWSTLP